MVWLETPSGPRIQRILLRGLGMRQAGAVLRKAPVIVKIGGQIRRFLAGEAVRFDLERVALERCGEFQRRVLLAEHAIPRGRVSTYGRIAAHIGCGGAARAVGQALAENPFPIVIPCHRAVRADGSLGGYQGGAVMKRALLVAEGVTFTAEGKVLMEHVHY